MVCKVKFFCFVFCLGILLQAGGAFGQEDTTRLEDLVVTATRSEMPLAEVGSSLTVITADDIERQQKRLVLDALREVPGLDVIRSGGPGATTLVAIRGANPEQTLVLIDGSRMNDPSTPGSSFDFANLTTDNIERIEILRGPQSTLYGSDAIGGVINIITRRGEGRPEGFLSMEGGSFATVREQAAIKGGLDKLDYSLGISRLDTGGISAAGRNYGNREDDGYHATSFSTRLGLKPSPIFDVDCTIRYLDTRFDMDNSGGAGQDDPNSIVGSEQLFVSSRARLSLFDDRWRQKLELAIINLDRDYRNDVDADHPSDMDRSTYHGEAVTLNWQHTLLLHPTTTVVLGVERRDEEAKSIYYSDSSWGPYSSIFPKQTARNTGVYVEDQLNLWDSWFTTVGARFDDHSGFGSKVTWRVTTSYLFKNTATRLRGSYGTGFKAPSLYQLYEPTYGNSALNPEKSSGWDAGIEQAFFEGRLDLGATWFANDFKDLIEFDSSAYTYRNISRAKSNGVELSATVRPADCLTLRAGYTWMETENKSTGMQLLRRPKNKFSFDANYRFTGKGNINLEILYVGKRDDYDYSSWPAERVELGGYLLMNMAASYDVTRWLQLFARVDNLLDRDYEEVKGYGNAGIGAYGGVKLSF
ncbi:MAG TPA: TonB-dependent receptor [Geobacteraceae bacterium]|nr:TonB-dependent receptor [Geobacteraceae bacterium]